MFKGFLVGVGLLAFCALLNLVGAQVVGTAMCIEEHGPYQKTRFSLMYGCEIQEANEWRYAPPSID